MAISFIAFGMTRRYVVHSGSGWTFLYYSTPTHIGAIVLGAIIALAEFSHPGWAARLLSKWRGLLCLVWLVAGFTALITSMPPISSCRPSLDFVFPLVCVGSALLLLLTMNWAPLRQFMSNRFLLWLSKLTYSMYVVHFFICDMCSSWIPSGWFTTSASFWAAHLIFGATLTVAAGQLSWMCLESKVLALRKYFRREKPAPDAPSFQFRSAPDMVCTSMSTSTD